MHHEAVLIGHEHGALGDVEEAGLLGDDAGVLDLEGLDRHAVEVGGEGHADAGGLGPRFLGEGAVDRDRDDVGAQFLVFVEEAGDLAEFVGADAGEGERDEEDDGLAFADVAAQVDVDEAGFGLLLQRDFREGLAEFEGHGVGGVRVDL